MTAAAFSITDRATWPEVLTAEETASILRRKVGGVLKACQERVMVPAPFEKYPYRWRRADVIRHVDGARLLQKASGY